MLEAGDKAVLALKFRVRFGMVAARVDGVGLSDLTPSVAGLRADMLRKKITPL